MTDAERNIIDLWTATYGEPPPVRSDTVMMIRALVEGLPEPSRVLDPVGSSASGWDRA